MNFFAILILALLFTTTACERVKEEGQILPQPPPLGQGVEPSATAPGAPVPSAPLVAPSLNVANVILEPKAGTPVTLAVEIANTPDERRQGLMGRENLGEKQGMWFVFEEDTQDPFWMKDTPISLDIIFVDKDFKIVDIIANATPNSELLLVPKQKYRYTLEVKAGTAAANKLAMGDKLEYRLGPP